MFQSLLCLNYVNHDDFHVCRGQRSEFRPFLSCQTNRRHLVSSLSSTSNNAWKVKDDAPGCPFVCVCVCVLNPWCLNHHVVSLITVNTSETPQKKKVYIYTELQNHCESTSWVYGESSSCSVSLMKKKKRKIHL